MLVKNSRAPIEPWEEWLRGGSPLHDALQDIHTMVYEVKQDFILFGNPVAITDWLQEMMGAIDSAYHIDDSILNRGYGDMFQMIVAAKQLIESEADVKQVAV